MVLLIKVIMICKLVKVFHGFSQVGDSYYMVIPLTIQNMGQIPLSNPSKIKTQQSHLFRMWTWCGNMGLSMEAKTRWQLKPHTSPMFLSLSFYSMNEGICKLRLNGTSPRICPFNKM